MFLKQQNAAGIVLCVSYPANFQVSVFGPLVFLEFMNYLPAAVSSQTRLFADDCILYRPIRHFSDCEALQNELDKLAQWEQQWACNSTLPNVTLSVTRSKTPFKYNDILKGHTLESVVTIK